MDGLELEANAGLSLGSLFRVSPLPCDCALFNSLSRVSETAAGIVRIGISHADPMVFFFLGTLETISAVRTFMLGESLARYHDALGNLKARRFRYQAWDTRRQVLSQHWEPRDFNFRNFQIHFAKSSTSRGTALTYRDLIPAQPRTKRQTLNCTFPWTTFPDCGL